MIMIHNKTILTLALSVTLSTPTLFANEAMIESIMKLRSEVETLYTQIDDNKEMYKSQMKSYMMQITDNEAQINRQDIALKLTEQNLLKLEEKMKTYTSKGEDLKPMVFEAIAGLVSEIKAGIPFKVDERVAALMKIKTDMTEGSITQEKAMALVWANYDDALRLTKEIGLFKQEIVLDGKIKLAKIAKIGSVMMFFSTPDNQVGYVVKKENDYVYKIETNEVEKAKIVTLYDALQKQIRTGYFSLPNALILRGVK